MSGWFIGMACAAILAAVAQSIMPPGPVRQVGSLICAMMLLWATLKPITASFHLFGTVQLDTQAWKIEEELEEKETQLLKALIEQECGTYIVDKAASLGADCSAVVICVADETGAWLPGSCRISGQLTTQQRGELEQIISTDLGIAPEWQEYMGGG